jgi:hypothetical protein
MPPLPRFPRLFLVMVPLLAPAGPALAQPYVAESSPQHAQPQIDPLDITGLTFAGLRLPLTVTTGRLELKALRAYSWAQSEPSIPGPPVQRLLLSGDAEVAIGVYRFTAQKAAVWIAPLPPGDPDAAPGVFQVFLYLDRAGSPTEAPAITLTGDRLPVQGVLRIEGGVKLLADRRLDGRPEDPFLAEAERALAQRLRRLITPAPPISTSPDDLIAAGLEVPALEPGEEPEAAVLSREQARARDLERILGPAPVEEPIFSPAGVVSFSAGSLTVVRSEQERSIIFSGGVTVEYWDPASDRTLHISAQQGVLFLKATASIEQTRFSAADVRSIYLEGDVVAQDGRYTLRSPRVFYDFENNRALLLDAVFWTYDARRGIPLYVRAKTISQEARDTYRATQARVTNTPFFEPDLSIGASSITFKRARTPAGEERTLVDARDTTLRVGRVPVFWWPRLSGDPQAIPLRDLRLENSSGSGAALKSTWNAYSLIGVRPPNPGDSLDLMIDEYFDRGPAVGADIRWGRPAGQGGLFAYTIPYDRGTDLLTTGVKKDHDGDFRGIVLGEHRAELNRDWTLFAEGAYLSDPTLADGFFEPMARTRREFATSLYLRRLRANSEFFAEGRGNTNDFIANQYLLESQGYNVMKLPDVGYLRLADDLLPEYPGLLAWSSEYRATRMRLQFHDTTAEEIGFNRAIRSKALFGIAPDQTIAEALRSRGFSEKWVDRFDTRHELAMPMAAGPLNITPFLIARFTGYDDDFSEYSPGADEPYRLWGAAGVTLSTEVQRIDNGMESRLLDLHRVRHIITPSLTVWHAGSTIDRVDLPVYDDGVESLAEGTATRLGISQLWQTQRGGPGRWRSVDVFRLDTDLVISSGDVDRESPINRYFDYRPELSNLGGTFGEVTAAWQVTDVLTLAARETFDFEINQSARTSAGARIQHNPEFSSFGEVLFLNAQDQTYAIVGADYQLTRKYDFSGNAAYDTRRGDVQTVSFEVRRHFPSVTLGIGVTYNNITSETSFGFVFQPLGAGNQGARFRGVGSAGGSSTFGG